MAAANGKNGSSNDKKLKQWLSNKSETSQIVGIYRVLRYVATSCHPQQHQQDRFQTQVRMN